MIRAVQSMAAMGINFSRASSVCGADVSSVSDGADAASLDGEEASCGEAFATGDRIQIHGLIEDAERRLNGKEGAVLKFEGSHQYSVILDDSAEPKSVHRKNLTKVGGPGTIGEEPGFCFQVGDCVVVVGLKNEEAQA